MRWKRVGFLRRGTMSVAKKMAERPDILCQPAVDMERMSWLLLVFFELMGGDFILPLFGFDFGGGAYEIIWHF